MAGTELKIDDEYINGMAEFLNSRAADLQEGINKYNEILASIRTDAIKKGQTAEALDTFISYAQNLSEIVAELGDSAKTTCTNFLAEIDENDEYLF